MNTENTTNAADALIAHLKRTTPRHTEYTLTPNRVEEMLAATIPGGSVADPQEIADAIREWFGYSPDDSEETPCSALDCDLAADYEASMPAWRRTPNAEGWWIAWNGQYPSLHFVSHLKHRDGLHVFLRSNWRHVETLGNDFECWQPVAVPSYFDGLNTKDQAPKEAIKAEVSV